MLGVNWSTMSDTFPRFPCKAGAKHICRSTEQNCLQGKAWMRKGLTEISGEWLFYVVLIEGVASGDYTQFFSHLKWF